MNRLKRIFFRRARFGRPAVTGILAAVLVSGLLLEMSPAAEDPELRFKELGVTRIPDIPPPMDFELPDLEGRRVRLSELKGKVVVINFWTTWCPSCRIEMPDLEKLHQHFRDRELVLLAVDLRESRQMVRKYFQDRKLNFTALLDGDGEVGRSFGIRSIPTTFIIDKSGGMVGKAFGARQWGGDRSFSLFEYLLSATSSPQDDGKDTSR